MKHFHFNTLPLVVGAAFAVISYIFPFTSVNADESDQSQSSTYQVPDVSNYLPTQSTQNQVANTPLAEIREQFANPGVDYATGPLWVWNDLLTEEQIRSTLSDLNAQNVNQAFVHPRPGLATPYLSEDWEKLWSVALDEAKNRGMKIWIYDENSYPSGFAGGYVPEAMPESRGIGLDVVITDSLVDANGAWNAGDSAVYVLELQPDGTARNRTKEIFEARDAKAKIPEKTSQDAKWIVARTQMAGKSQWFGGRSYVNLIQKGVVNKFIEITHEWYRQRFGEEFGKLIPGVFTDEPQVASAGTLSWTNDFPEEFQARCGYDLIPRLGSLVAPLGDWKRVRYDYYNVVMQLFAERWHRPIAEYCETFGLQYCGHDWEHEWPNAHHVPDNMATAFWRQRPSIDLLMNTFSKSVHGQFGNARSVRELSSIAHQAGRSRTLSENYGAGGYDIRFADLKRLGDWSYALGVNTSDEHLSYISIRGARKHDHPQTFSYHSPWFEQYSKLEDYWTRLSYILSRGELTHSRALILEPTSTVWMYQQNSGAESGKKDGIANAFTALLNRLESEQIDYDLGSEDVIARIGSVDGPNFKVGQASYRVVALPPELENLSVETTRLLAKFAENGGKIVSLGDRFTYVGGRGKAQLQSNAENDYDAYATIQKVIDRQEFDAFVQNSRVAQPLVVLPQANADNLFHMTRETPEALILFLCNIDLENSASGRIILNNEWDRASIEEFVPATGDIRTYDKKDFTLAPCESIVLVVSKTAAPPATKLAQKARVINIAELVDQGALKSILPVDDNVLVMDYVTVKLGDETRENEYFYRANGWFWNKKGYPKSPWDNGVQYKDELITKRFDDESGFELTYRFMKSEDELADLKFVVESPDMFKVYCNGKELARIPNAWKFDRAFGVFDLNGATQPGANEIKLVAEKATVFVEIMPAWIVGKFSLEPTEHGFTIASDKGLSLAQRDGDATRTLRASSELERVSWLSAGVNFCERDDRAPAIEFTFKQNATIGAIDVWNYCEANLAKRGVKECVLSVVDHTGRCVESEPVATLQLRQGDSRAERITLPKPINVAINQRVKLTVVSNWNGITYPLPNDFVGTTQPSNDNAFVGLAEIRFLSHDGLQALETKEATASSELVFRSHERRAKFTIDGSGLYTDDFGWAAQGYPFYANAVDYTFDASSLLKACESPLRLSIDPWNGAVAAILVNGKQVGAIGWKGETVEITDALQELVAANHDSCELVVRVYGTPKNLFGPHHAGKLRGSAWPGSFHTAPSQPPRGEAYDVINYGLFRD